jgi:putative tricarboxylic transport membrane protein
VNFTASDVGVLLVVGILGYFMRRYGYPVAPMVVAMILGPMFEVQLRRSLQLSQNDPTTLFSSPFAVVVYVSMALIFVGTWWLRRRQAALESVAAKEEVSA